MKFGVGFYWHFYHQGLFVETHSDDVKERRVVIKLDKPKIQHELRLLLLRKVKSKKNFYNLSREEVIEIHKRECLGCPFNYRTDRLFNYESNEGKRTSDKQLKKMVEKIKSARRKKS